MVSTTSAGTMIAMTAAAPATQDSAGYSAAGMVYTTIGGVESLPAVGPQIAVNSFQPLNGPQDKLKGPVNYGSVQIPYAHDKADAGQTLLRTAGAPGNNALYSFKETLTNGDIIYFQGRVFGYQITAGSATGVLMGNTTVEIVVATVYVPAP